MAFLNPTVNAYRRILPDSLAPTHANWGLDNRTTFVRIPPERGGATRVEVRVGDGAANPYLGIAAVLFAGLDGVRRGLDPGEPLAGDAYTAPEDRAGGRLPTSLERRARRARGRRGDRRRDRGARSSRRSSPSSASSSSATGPTCPSGSSRSTSTTSRAGTTMGIAADLRLEDVDLADHDNFVERVPHEMFALLRREDPVFFQHEPDGPGFWCITRYDDINAVAPRLGDLLLRDAAGRRCRTCAPTRSRRASR